MKDFLIDPLKNLKSYKSMLNDLEKDISPIATYGIIDENLSHMAYALKSHTKKPVFLITYDENRSRKLYEHIKNLGEMEVELFPKKEILFYDIHLTSSESANQRLKVMSKLIKQEDVLIVSSLEAILDKIISKSIYNKHIIKINLGDEVDLNLLTDNLIESGYEELIW